MALTTGLDKYNFGIVGSTGAVGEMVLQVLAERNFPLGELKLFCSEKSAGKEQRFGGQQLVAQELTEDAFTDLDLCIFSAGGDISRKWVPICAANDCIAIDNSSAFRMDENTPLVVPEVNPRDAEHGLTTNIVANPNCSTIQMVVALAPLHAEYGLQRVIVSTYQSASGAGQKAIDELSNQVIALFNSQDAKTKVFPHQLAFNCIPHIDVFEKDGYSREEKKIVRETQKILHLPNLKISATSVRVPTFNSHSESVYFELEDDCTVEDIRTVLQDAPGVTVQDDPGNNIYPLPFTATGKDDVYVGRIRADLDQSNAFHMWVVSDNLRKGAATNAVQIAETLIRSVQ